MEQEQSLALKAAREQAAEARGFRGASATSRDAALVARLKSAQTQAEVEAEARARAVAHLADLTGARQALQPLTNQAQVWRRVLEDAVGGSLSDLAWFRAQAIDGLVALMLARWTEAEQYRRGARADGGSKLASNVEQGVGGGVREARREAEAWVDTAELEVEPAVEDSEGRAGGVTVPVSARRVADFY